ncbi:MAG: response regulator transcription factor [Chloroflexi bacterium]|nr:response regulator transcription factor [Chloroflexota bacterium]
MNNAGKKIRSKKQMARVRRKVERIRVLLADDNPKFRDKATNFLNRQAGLIVIEQTGDAQATRKRARAQQPDVILYDLQMPGTSWMENIPRLRRAAPRTRIIVVSLLDDPVYQYVTRVVGAHGFVSKARLTEDLIPTIRQLTSTTQQIVMRLQSNA